VWERDPQGRLTTAAYDSAGNGVSLTDRYGRSFTRAYDALGRDTSFTTPDAGTLRYRYDNPRSRWLVVENGESTDTLFYLPTGELWKHVAVMGGQRYEVRTDFEFGRRTAQYVYTGNPLSPTWSGSTGWNYDGSGRLARIVDPSGQETGLHYNPEDLADTLTYPGGTVRLGLSYDGRHRLSRSTYSVAGLNTPFGSGQVAYDAVDRVLRRTSADGKRERTFSYDGLGRLGGFAESKEVLTGPNCTTPSSEEDCMASFQTVLAESFGYSAVGNRTTWSYDDSASVPVSRSATLQANSNRYATFAGWTLLYDSVGNLVRRYNGTQDITYRWNSIGQRTGVNTAATGWVDYYYNGLGERVRRVNAGATTRYLYEGGDLVVELDGSGNRIRHYAYWPGLDQPHSVTTWESGQSGTYYYALDVPANHVRGLFSATGTIKNAYQYRPFGEVQAATGTVANPLRLMARELDAGAGLYYVRARWYDPYLGRFISEDPIGLAGGINNYAYAANDPVNRNDPLGLSHRCYDSFGDLWGIVVRSYVGGCEKKGHEPSEFGNPRGEEQVDGTGWGMGRARDDTDDNEESLLEEVWECTKAHYGGADNASHLLSYAGAAPVPKRLFGYPVLGGASRTTNVLNAVVRQVAGPLPIPGSLGKWAFRTLGSKSAVTLLGRTNVVLAWAFFAYDAASISICVAQEDQK
jgi:RHS repeat-associated protein